MIAKILSIEEEMNLIRLEERQEGKKEELIDMLVIQLKKKFKIDILPNNITERINKAEMEHLEEIRNDIFDIQRIEEVEKYL